LFYLGGLFVLILIQGGTMDLNTVSTVLRPSQRQALPTWQSGDAWLGGGTWLFSQLQPDVHRLIDLDGLAWPSLEVTDQGLRIAATCRISELHDLVPPADWTAASLIGRCCNSLLMSFKIWHMASVGGNICMSLPAGAMISLTTALQGVCELWAQDGGERRLPVEQFVTGNNENVLRPGELLRAIEIPLVALRSRAAFRQISLNTIGRSAALLIGMVSPEDSCFALTVTASTIRPVRMVFPALPSQNELRARITDEIPDSLLLDDVHGEPVYRKHINYLFAEQIRSELAQGAA
jgi:CO/xanthine dehydrogenase FAD-binding subunit